MSQRDPAQHRAADAERKRRERAERRKGGAVLHQVWAYPDDIPRIRDYAARKRRARERNLKA